MNAKLLKNYLNLFNLSTGFFLTVVGIIGNILVIYIL